MENFMNESDQMPLDQITVDRDNLYREETITDLKIATIRRIIPIKSDGSDDKSRPTMYIAQTSIMSQMGPLPIQAPIEAPTLEEALDKFPEAIREAVDRMVEEAQEARHQESSRIVVPGAGVPGMGGQSGTGGIIRG